MDMHCAVEYNDFYLFLRKLIVRTRKWIQVKDTFKKINSCFFSHFVDFQVLKSAYFAKTMLQYSLKILYGHRITEYLMLITDPLKKLQIAYRGILYPRQ
jgi:hypothetical protein